MRSFGWRRRCRWRPPASASGLRTGSGRGSRTRARPARGRGGCCVRRPAARGTRLRRLRGRRPLVGRHAGRRPRRKPARTACRRLCRCARLDHRADATDAFNQRVPAEIRRLDGEPLRERTLLELPLGRSPPQGALSRCGCACVRRVRPRTGSMNAAGSPGAGSTPSCGGASTGASSAVVAVSRGSATVSAYISSDRSLLASTASAGPSSRASCWARTKGCPNDFATSSGRPAVSPARGLGPERARHRPRPRRPRMAARDSQVRARARRRRSDRRLCPGGRLAAVGRARGRRRGARLARVARLAPTRSLARSRPGSLRAARLDARDAARARFPALFRRGRGHLRGRAKAPVVARGLSSAGRPAGGAGGDDRLRSSHGADRLAPLRGRAALRRAGERPRRPGRGAAPDPGPRRGGRGAGSPVGGARHRLAERLARRIPRLVCTHGRRAAVRAGRLDAGVSR